MTVTRKDRRSAAQRWLDRWERLVLLHPWRILLITAVACAACLLYTSRNLTFSTDTEALLSAKLPFHQNRLRVDAAFPQDVRTILLVVTGKTPGQTSRAMRSLEQALREDARHFDRYYMPENLPFFATHGLLYKDLDTLESLSASALRGAPLIGALAADPVPDRFFDILGQAVLSDPQRSAGRDLLLGGIGNSLRAAAAGDRARISWQQLLTDPEGANAATERVMLVTPKLDPGQLLPAEPAIQALRQIINRIQAEAGAGTRIRMTGETVLEYEEMTSLSEGVTVAAVVSLLLVCLTLLLAYQSLKLMLATFLTLSVGLAFSMAFATAAIGHLNLISIAFAVLFIGMGDAYSSHFCLRYRELLQKGSTQQIAIRETLATIGPSLALCTLTAAMGLYAFIPTSYTGVSELGIIAGTSLLIALLTTFTVLPALLRVMPIKTAPAGHRWSDITLPAWLSDLPLRHARVIRIATLVLAALAAALLTRVEVDFNPVNLRDPASESVQVMQDLIQSKDHTPLTAVTLAADANDAQIKKAAFEKLPAVGRVVTVLDFIPADQPQKLALIRTLQTTLGADLDRLAGLTRGNLHADALQRFRTVIDTAAQSRPADSGLLQLRAALDLYLETFSQADPGTGEAMTQRLQDGVFGDLPETLDVVKAGLTAGPVQLADLPAELRERWLSREGLHRIEIFPRDDLNNLENLRRFTQQVKAADARVSGLPVIYVDSMSAVIRAFVQAFAIALAASAVILLVLLRNWKDVLLVLLPLLLASVFTAAVTVLIGLPFNFANIIALPLLFGLGIDSGIHMAHRLHDLKNSGKCDPLFSSSESKGVFYGTLTTIFSFSSLAFIAHRGTASMGELLAIGLLLTLACALVVLPAFGSRGLENRRG